MREGMSIKDACKKAGVTIGVVNYRRKHDKEYAARFEKCKQPRAKPTSAQHLTLASKKKTMTKERQAWWDIWNDAAAAGTLAKRFPLKEMT